MKYTRFAVLFCLLALLVAVVPAFAQDETFGLSPEDFALFSAANANSAAAQSLAYDFTLDLTVAGIEDTEVSGSINGTGELSTADMQFSLATTGSLTANGEETPTIVEVRVIGDMVYFNIGEGWQGSKLEDLAATAGGAAGLPVNPEDLASGDLSGMGDMGGMMGDLATLDSTEYVSMERLDDMDGRAHFSTALDIAGLLTSEELSGVVGMALGGAMGGGSEMTPEQAAQMGQMMGMMFADATFTLDQYVNVETELVDQTVLTINLPLEAILGAPGAVVSLTFDINLKNFDQPVSIEVPENVTMVESGS
ncbi:MAG: hypothetical protein J0M07_22020 [Anaerolineae bacterium]|jgi:hypothetical protein|nr:hypothetical protein [Anaerolineae bacterium]